MEKLETRVYQRENNHNIPVLIKESLTDIWNSRFLSRQLAERDIKAQYRQSYFGIVWAFVSPLMTGAVWIFLNLSGTIKVSDTGIPYPVYAFSGTLIWSILTEAINTPATSTKGARGLISRPGRRVRWVFRIAPGTSCVRPGNPASGSP